MYKVARIGASGFTAASLLIGYACLYLQMHSFVFVFAVFVLGLATPGWGCSFVLASEVFFPAREATVCPLLEAFSNLAGVGAIIVTSTQWLIDAGLGARGC